MHHRLIVLVSAYEDKMGKGKGKIRKVSGKVKRFKNKKEVAKEVSDSLENQGFTFQGRFAQGPADFFEIGGRWTGELTAVQLSPLLLKSFSEKLDEINFPFGSKKEAMKSWKRMEKIFYSYFPKFKGTIPFGREIYSRRLGKFAREFWEDDVQIVSKKLWNRLIKKGIAESTDDFMEDQILNLEDTVSSLEEKNVVDKMYACVVDYHN